jgi:hypothetical protein
MGRIFAVARGRQCRPRRVKGWRKPPISQGRNVREQDVREQARLRGRPGKLPLHTRFKKGQSGNPRGARSKNLPALLVEAFDDKVVVTIDGERREITKREAIAKQLVNKSTGADLRATKMLIDALKDAEKKAGVTQPPEPAPFTAADEEVMATFIARLRRAWEEELRERGAENPGSSPEL